MLNNGTFTRAHLKTPRAAAIAGIAFSVLTITYSGCFGVPFRPIRSSLALGLLPIRKR
jgi:hypothetical protein